MVAVSIVGDQLALEVLGWDKLWAFRSRIDMQLEHVRDVRAVTSRKELKEITNALGYGMRVPGTELPGVISAGSYYFSRGGRVFMDVHYPVHDVLVLELEGEYYRKVIVDVDNAADAAEMIVEALATQSN